MLNWFCFYLSTHDGLYWINQQSRQATDSVSTMEI